MQLNTEILSTGVMQVTRDSGEVVGTITPRGNAPGFWVNMVGITAGWDAMPVRSLEAGQYLILAGVHEHDARG